MARLIALAAGFIFAGLITQNEARLFSRSCGYRPKHFKRIVGGQTAEAWPWQADILLKKADGSGYEHKCGGTLIHRYWVVTSASCLFQKPFPDDYLVKLGEYDRSKKERGEQTIAVSAIRLHRGFLTSSGWGNDIALLKLKRRARLSRSVIPACLPRQGQSASYGTSCYMTGWGKVAYDQGLSDVLQEARLPVVSYTECDMRNSKQHQIDWRSMLCAGYDDNKTKTSGCNGDSGGPLVCRTGRRWVLHGVTSWGSLKCDGTAAYSVFSKVSNFVHWIYHTMVIGPRPPPHGCRDNHWYCGQWKRKGYCTNSYYMNSLKIYCPKSCGHCK